MRTIVTCMRIQSMLGKFKLLLSVKARIILAHRMFLRMKERLLSLLMRMERFVIDIARSEMVPSTSRKALIVTL